MSMSLYSQDCCVFCQVIRWQKKVEILAQFDHCFVIRDQYPVSKGHLLVISNDHIDNWFAAPIQIKSNMIDVLDKMKLMLDKEYQPSGYNVGINCGKTAGQIVMHLHLHLISRFEGVWKIQEGALGESSHQNKNTDESSQYNQQL